MLAQGRKLKANDASLPEAKIALLGDSSTQQLAPILKAALHQRGIFGDVYEADYNVIDQEIFDAASSLYAFSPTYVVLQISLQQLREQYYHEERKGAATAEKALAQTRQRWSVLGQRLSCRVIQFLYERPAERPFGHYTGRVSDSLAAAVDALNAGLTNAAKEFPNVFLVDIDHLASRVGKAQWRDEKLWFHAKMFCRPDCLPEVGVAIAAIVAAGEGRAKKCVVVDLDNTLWGGIVAEDGMDGIELGDHGAGEAFVLFQHFLLSLKERGLILAVCSKNERDVALDVIRRHPNMILREADFSAMAINWNNKSDNLRQIASSLNIGVDSLIFVDDSPFERHQVQAALPEVLVPEMPEDPAQFVPFFNSLNMFETLSFSAEDRGRAELYLQQAARDQEKAQFSDISDYLRSLQMKIAMRPFDSFTMPRVVQLLQRSNQFNLTTKRYNEKDCEGFLSDPAWQTLAVSLNDKYGDSGLISVIILHREAKTLKIDTWLMSCRVLQRGVEQFCMNAVVEIARDSGSQEISGTYIPTEKNAMVRDFFARFGFRKTDQSLLGTTQWTLPVADYKEQHVFIARAEGSEWTAQKS